MKEYMMCDSVAGGNIIRSNRRLEIYRVKNGYIVNVDRSADAREGLLRSIKKKIDEDPDALENGFPVLYDNKLPITDTLVFADLSSLVKFISTEFYAHDDICNVGKSIDDVLSGKEDIE